MPKIRGIKPDFWTDDVVVELSPLARLLFMGLWTYACDNGHIEDKPRQIKMRILPADDCKVGDLLTELETAGRVSRKDGWVLIPNFVKHQKVDKRFFVTCDREDCNKPGEGPETPTSQPESRRDHDEATSSTRRDHDGGSKRPPGDGDGDGDGDGEVMVKGAAKSRRRSTTIPKDWKPTEAHQAIAAEERVNVAVEARKFRDSNEAKGRTYVDWDAAFRNWLRSPYAVKTGPAPAITDPSQLPPVEPSWMRRRR